MSLTATGAGHGVADGSAAPDPLEPVARLFRDLRSSSHGLSAREAARRLEVFGPNELARRGGRRWPGELARQFTHPLALLPALAAVLAWVSGTPPLGIAIAAVIVLNAGFAFAQEMQAERAVEALAAPSGVDLPAAARAAGRRQLFRFDPRRKLMTTVDARDGGLAVHTKGAAEIRRLLVRCSSAATAPRTRRTFLHPHH